MSSKFRFLFETSQPSGKTSSVVMVETNNRPQAVALRNRFITMTGGTIRERTCKRVRIMKVDSSRFQVFNAADKPVPRRGQVFNSIDALAEAIAANPVTLRASLSRARKNTETKTSKATVRGITYAYVD